MISVEEFMAKHGKYLNLSLLHGLEAIKKVIKNPEIQRPGLSLAGYTKSYSQKRILVFGKVEIEYLRHLDVTTRLDRLSAILTQQIPLVIITRLYRPPKELVDLCHAEGIPILRTRMSTMNLFSKLTMLLSEEFSPSVTCHGTLVEAFGVGVLIQGDSSVGKSEAALGLIERGHRLVSDDIVQVKRKEGGYLEGSGPELTRHLLEIRGIGIINVAHLYGAVCISGSKRIDTIVKLEEWDDNHFYDRVGLEEKYLDLLGVKIPFLILPLKPGRDVVLLIETIVLNYRLKKMGYNSAKEFNVKLLETIAARQKTKKILQQQPTLPEKLKKNHGL